MKLDLVADMEVDKVADKVADMEVDKVADMVKCIWPKLFDAKRTRLACPLSYAILLRLLFIFVFIQIWFHLLWRSTSSSSRACSSTSSNASSIDSR